MAVEAPEFAVLVVNVVVPHPLMVAVPRGLVNWNVGSSRSILSGVAVSRGEFKAKMYVMDDGAAVTGFAITSLLLWNADVGAVIAVEAVMDPVVAAMSVAVPKVTATVRVFRFAVCVTLLAVTPLGTLTVHGS